MREHARTIQRIRRGAVLVAALAALALPAAALGGARVPLKISDSGSWGVGVHDCGSQLPVFVDTTGTGTHLGRYAYASQECADLGGATFAGAFTITAANGDTLVGTYAGTFTVDGGGTIHYEQTNTVTGGTGRFAGASGSFHVSGLAYGDGRDVQRAAGWIGRIGGS
jgi:hypothetical protein